MQTHDRNRATTSCAPLRRSAGGTASQSSLRSPPGASAYILADIGLRYPAHLRSPARFQRAHRPGVSGALLPRDHAKTTEALHLVARLIGERRGEVKVIIPRPRPSPMP